MNKIYCKYAIGVLTAFLFCINTFAEIPAGYYDAADGKSEAELKTIVYQIVRNFINLDFDNFSATYWGDVYFKKSDWNPAGYYWDMYSDIQRAEYNSSQMAREHCMPRSWWGTSSDYGRANGDLNNLFPSDFTANGRKSNLPLGQISNPAWTNNISKTGPNAYSSDYTGNAFEPTDEYKGDFARTYLYMATCYQDYETRWKDDGLSMLNNETYPVFKDWAISLLLDWHRQDPVSEKETNRNNSVFGLQQNRNPFIDIPDLAEYIWGNKKTQSIAIADKVLQPTLITPSVGVQINFGEVMTSSLRTRSIPVKGLLFNSPLTIDFLENVSGFFSTEGEIPVAQLNQPEGYFLPLTYDPKAEGTHTAKLRINSAELSEPIVVQLSGKATYKMSIDPVEPADDMDVMLFYTGPWEVASLPANFIANVKSGPYSNGDFSFRNNKEYLIIEFDEEPGILQFSIYPRNSWGTNNNHLYVYEGTSSANFEETPVADFDNTFVVNETYNNTPQIQLSKDTRAIKFEYIKQAQNVGINNVIITRKPASSKINDKNERTMRIFCSEGLLHIENIRVGETICVYDILGKIKTKETATEEQITIPFQEKGVFLLKTNAGVYKFVSK